MTASQSLETPLGAPRTEFGVNGMMAGILTYGSQRLPGLPKSFRFSGLSGALANYSCGGSHRIGEINHLTAFPFLRDFFLEDTISFFRLNEIP